MATTQNLTNVFGNTGAYNVSLTVSNVYGNGSAEQTINVYGPTTAAFTANVTSGTHL